ncbi:MAG: macrolide ABC transporter ATP-binding protein [Candidatus Komeilibacteria bacterium RIFCSPLOWO2_02_FULL_48_11]|uniref:Macrolide ABC transporter ATP-binding protein n=1 Tax=Candidatus Komeilibacteria bacterium RIFCSPLOWO2_02_FULL_48_11 TaxID=1798553 RepID=A0A1G2BRP6_9BACT|nr:MAG: macrolide ABC transporter ATP-binding protein [Candidatus Komeilibacteria bacterium RIFCSPLOWO2_02_FULL_48_11]
MPLIEVKNLEKVYRNDSVATSALAGVSFDINDNEFVAIMGPSGSGKSTLLHVLGFLDDYTGGEYRFDGKTVFDYSKDDIAHVRNQKMGFIFQAFNLLARTSVLDNVKLPLVYSSVPPEKWDEMALKAIESVGLSHRLYHQPSQLSGGEQQRVAIARAIVNNPNVIFADEPTGNLDSKSGGQVMEVIQRLHDEGHTVVLITHETYTAEYAERIITLRDGLIESDRKVMERRRAAEHFVK